MHTLLVISRAHLGRFWLRQVTKDAAFRANALGWCIEWVSQLTSLLQINFVPVHVPHLHSPSFDFVQLQAFFLVADDIMDNSVTRRGQPCWYRMPEVLNCVVDLHLFSVLLATVPGPLPDQLLAYILRVKLWAI